MLHASEISIRAPLAGSDRIGRLIASYHGISTRAPLAGSDDKLPWFCFPGQISIRAPLAGSDNRRRCRRLRPAYFNSRSLCGERRTIFGSRASALAFQSALPLRGATMWLDMLSMCGLFQSALPLRGATTGRPSAPVSKEFQSALPLLGGSDLGVGRVDFHVGISIRAPLAGSDCLRESTFRAGRISIRAPLAGSDGPFIMIRTRRPLFQSARPLRGATIVRSERDRGDDFNPRSPCGERRWNP